MTIHPLATSDVGELLAPGNPHEAPRARKAEPAAIATGALRTGGMLTLYCDVKERSGTA